MRIWVAILGAISLAGCVEGTNPFVTNSTSTTTDDTTGTTTGGTTTGTSTNTTTDTTTTTTDSGTEIQSSIAVLPGTASPTPTDLLFRREARSEEITGNGYAEGFSYDADADLFVVDNLAFDGVDGYTVVPTPTGGRLGIGPFTAFQNDAIAVDGLTSQNIDQLTYRALYGISADGNSEIAIVRTAAYINFGFGGFIYQRNGSVTLPESGQAVYTAVNGYGGLRDFNNQSGLEYVQGDVEVRIDFNDFNDGAGVAGYVTNRRVFDINQNDITADILAAFGGGVTRLPSLIFEIAPGVLDANGELTGEVQSTNPLSGAILSEGNYYAVLSGDNAETIAGVIVVTGESVRNTAATVRETGGFFAVRQ